MLLALLVQLASGFTAMAEEDPDLTGTCVLAQQAHKLDTISVGVPVCWALSHIRQL